MSLPNHLGPDHYLDLAKATAVSKKDVAVAWECAYDDLRRELASRGRDGILYVVFGLQGAGKTSWIERHAPGLGPHAVFFDGPLPSRRHRARALSIAREFDCRTVAVWIDTPLDVALAHNARRPGLARIKAEAILHVLERLEPATRDEGFHEVLRIPHTSFEA